MERKKVILHRVEDAVNDIMGVSHILMRMMADASELNNETWAFGILVDKLLKAAETIQMEVLDGCDTVEKVA